MSFVSLSVLLFLYSQDIYWYIYIYSQSPASSIEYRVSQIPASPTSPPTQKQKHTLLLLFVFLIFEYIHIHHIVLYNPYCTICISYSRQTNIRHSIRAARARLPPPLVTIISHYHHHIHIIKGNRAARQAASRDRWRCRRCQRSPVTVRAAYIQSLAPRAHRKFHWQIQTKKKIKNIYTKIKKPKIPTTKYLKYSDIRTLFELCSFCLRLFLSVCLSNTQKHCFHNFHVPFKLPLYMAICIALSLSFSPSLFPSLSLSLSISLFLPLSVLNLLQIAYPTITQLSLSLSLNMLFIYLCPNWPASLSYYLRIFKIYRWASLHFCISILIFLRNLRYIQFSASLICIIFRLVYKLSFWYILCFLKYCVY